ncbi:MAG: hypothetical protein GF350_06610 [Chitinivibrionales bacterium]|nr:hypothetical protein [Chitinivibrionales bacterium]
MDTVAEMPVSCPAAPQNNTLENRFLIMHMVRFAQSLQGTRANLPAYGPVMTKSDMGEENRNHQRSS